jgi:hypothetical protein
MKHKLLYLTTSAVLVLMVTGVMVFPGVFAAHADSGSTKYQSYGHRVAHVNGLNLITKVGSTGVVLDANNKTVPVDSNPYGIVVVPQGMPHMGNGFKAGDVLVTDIGGNHDGDVLVHFPVVKGPAHLFNMPVDGNKQGPAMLAINAKTGDVWVADLAGNNIRIFAENGALKTTLTNPLFNHPWGMAYNGGTRNPYNGSTASFFTSNALDATIDRIDLVWTHGMWNYNVFQIGQLTRGPEKTKIGLVWTPAIRIGGTKYTDVLLAVDPVNNRIAAYPHSTTYNTSAATSMNNGLTAFQGSPLNVPSVPTLNPLDPNSLLVTNQNDNKVVELNLNVQQVTGWHQLDNVPVDPANGNGSALFGVVAVKDAAGNLRLFFTDDNTNTLDQLSVS